MRFAAWSSSESYLAPVIWGLARLEYPEPLSESTLGLGLLLALLGTEGPISSRKYC